MLSLEHEMKKKAKTEYFRLLSRIQLSVSGSKYEIKKKLGAKLCNEKFISIWIEPNGRQDIHSELP